MHTSWNSRLKNVAWGYREKFAEALGRIEQSGQLDTSYENRAFLAFDRAYMELVGKDFGTDHAADAFLQALEGKLSWILSVPDLLESWAGFGLKLLNTKLYFAIRYFELWNRSIEVANPSEMRFIINVMHLVEESIGAECALAFLEGYQKIKDAVSVEKVKEFADEGIRMFSHKPKEAEKFFRLELASSKKAIDIISKKCSQKEIRERLVRLFKGICGFEGSIFEISELDTEELTIKGSATVCLFNGLYLPVDIMMFDSVKLNREWYLASVYINAFAHLFNGFPTAHGLAGFESSGYFLKARGVGADFISQELFYIIDVYRILSSACKVFPGAKRIIGRMIDYEKEKNLALRRVSLFHMILYRLLCEDYTFCMDKKLTVLINEFTETVKEIAFSCTSFYDVADNLPKVLDNFYDVFQDCVVNLNVYGGILSFYSDYSFRVRPGPPLDEARRLDNAKDGKSGRSGFEESDDHKGKIQLADSDFQKELTEGSETCGNQEGFLYDEWNNDTQDYLHEWCCVQEIRDFYMESPHFSMNPVPDKKQTKEIRQVFERLKPDLLRTRNNMTAGDEMQLNRLINYLVEKKAGFCPEERIYCKKFKDERDIATALLIDVSGSTADSVEDSKVLEIEKSAAFLLAEGLLELDDRFGIFGFTGGGRGKCSYYIFKEFDEDWKEVQQKRLLGCHPNGSTRIGAAIRHTTNKLKQLDSERKLMIIITDGKPQDTDGYTSDRLYAQHDVRMACIEAKRNGIVVFCLSTENNSLSELELMFPVKRYVVMRKITELPQLLAKSYIKLTM
ncbi:MAG TPA: VWA domain-containing protein [Clostridiaceae bacterium]|nr:VWA domain-containing protein [Clostridiaceae bacterium]